VADVIRKARSGDRARSELRGRYFRGHTSDGPCLPSTAGDPAVPGQPPSGCIGYAIRCTRAGIVVIECPRASRSAGRWIDRCVCNERCAMSRGVSCACPSWPFWSYSPRSWPARRLSRPLGCFRQRTAASALSPELRPGAARDLELSDGVSGVAELDGILGRLCDAVAVRRHSSHRTHRGVGYSAGGELAVGGQR
jgi:hypothetical protein